MYFLLVIKSVFQFRLHYGTVLFIYGREENRNMSRQLCIILLLLYKIGRIVHFTSPELPYFVGFPVHSMNLGDFGRCTALSRYNMDLFQIEKYVSACNISFILVFSLSSF